MAEHILNLSTREVEVGGDFKFQVSQIYRVLAQYQPELYSETLIYLLSMFYLFIYLLIVFVFSRQGFSVA